MNNIKLLLLTIIVALYAMPFLSQSMPNRISDVAEIFDGKNIVAINSSMDDLKSKTGINAFIFTYFMGESTYTQNHLSLSNLAIEIQNTIIFYVRLIQEEDGSISPEIIFAPTDDLISQFKVPEKVALLIQEEILDEKLAPSYRIPMDLTANVVNAITKSFGVVKNIKDNDWDEKVRNYGFNFSQKNEYLRQYAGFDMNYYEFKPLDKDSLEYSDYSEEDLELLYDQNSTSNKYVVLESSDKVEKFDDANLNSDFDKTDQLQIDRYNRLMEVKGILEDYEYINPDQIVSDWEITSKNYWTLYQSKREGFKDKDIEEHKLIMFLEHKIMKGEYMPNMAWRQNYGSWRPTRCNIFASDFSKKYLKDKSIPWGSRFVKSGDIYNNCFSYDGVYELTDNDQIHKYLENGYPIYITTPNTSVAGHIAILYSTEDDLSNKAEIYKNGKILQAGSKNGIVPVNETWGTLEVYDDAKFFIYLKYLID